MKKWIVIAVTVVLLLTLACVYWLIPNTVFISEERSFHGNAHLLYRMLMNDKGKFWQQHGEAQGDSDGRGLLYQGNHYRIIDRQLNSLTILVNHHQPTQLNFISPEADSVRLAWEARVSLSSSPFQRIRQYFGARRLPPNMAALLAQMQAFAADGNKAYGRRIDEAHVRDSILVFTYGEANGYPSMAYVYGLIGQLKNYARSQSAHETGLPMLHITTNDSARFLVKVALPVDQRLKPHGKIAYKWMLGGGNILVTDVKGGPAAIRQAYEELDHYADDHHRVAPAIPFESLVTDRLQEKDTAKWVTRIYYPVM